MDSCFTFKVFWQWLFCMCTLQLYEPFIHLFSASDSYVYCLLHISASGLPLLASIFNFCIQPSIWNSAFGFCFALNFTSGVWLLFLISFTDFWLLILSSPIGSSFDVYIFFSFVLLLKTCTFWFLLLSSTLNFRFLVFCSTFVFFLMLHLCQATAGPREFPRSH